MDTSSTTQTPLEPPRTYSYELGPLDTTGNAGGLQARKLQGVEDECTISHNIDNMSNLLVQNISQAAVFVLDGGVETPKIFLTYDSAYFSTATQKELRITIGDDSWDIILDPSAETDPNIYYTSTVGGITAYILVK